jgi:hypothetical protein
MSGLTSAQGPYKLVSVNTSSERAARMIGRLIEDVKDKYTIVHSANADSEYFLRDQALETGLSQNSY